MVKRHIQSANGADAPPGVRLSYQAVLVIVAILSGAWTGEDYLRAYLLPSADGAITRTEYTDLIERLQRLEGQASKGSRYTAEMALERERVVNAKFERMVEQLAEIKIELERVRAGR